MQLNIPLEICASGSISPLGRGVDALHSSQELSPELIPLLSDADQKAAVLRINPQDPELLKWRSESRLRRASSISVFMADVVKQVLDQHPVDPSQLGLVTAFSTGILTYSRKFYHEIVTQGPRFASPILFPETVFNSPASHTVSIFKIGGPSYSVLGDDASWVNALSIAASWIHSGQVPYVLVLGAEELDLAKVEAFKSAGWLKKNSLFIPAEGCGAVLLRRSQSKDYPKIIGISEGFTYRKKKDAAVAARESLECFRKYPRVLKTSQKTWFDSIENQIHQEGNFQSISQMPYHGDAFAASAAWNTIRALKFLNEKDENCVVPIWGLNHQCSSLLLGNRFIG